MAKILTTWFMDDPKKIRVVQNVKSFNADDDHC